MLNYVFSDLLYYNTEILTWD